MIFINNKYTTLYFKIISTAQHRESTPGYVEKHHIIPKSLGGSNKKSNLVILTAREHFICHLLLVKMTDNKNKVKMVYAVWMMVRTSNSNSLQRYKPTARLYQKLREDYINVAKTREVSVESRKKQSVAMKWKHVGDKNPRFGIPHSEETKQKMSNAKKGKYVGDKNPMFGIPLSEETRQKISNAKKGKNVGDKNPMFGASHSEEARTKISIAGKNRSPISEETRQKMIFAQQNRAPISEETRQKMIKSAKKRIFKTVVCPHCGLSGKGGNMSRWHGDNCKMNPKLR